MATNTAGDTGQQYHTRQTHYLWKDLVFGDDASQKTIGVIPPGAYVTAVRVAVTTAFNDSGNDYVDVGTVADPDGLAADVDVSSVGVKLPTTIATSDDVYSTSAVTLVCQYDGANSDMTAGACRVIVEYIV